MFNPKKSSLKDSVIAYLKDKKNYFGPVEEYLDLMTRLKNNLKNGLKKISLTKKNKEKSKEKIFQKYKEGIIKIWNFILVKENDKNLRNFLVSLDRESGPKHNRVEQYELFKMEFFKCANDFFNARNNLRIISPLFGLICAIMSLFNCTDSSPVESDPIVKQYLTQGDFPQIVQGVSNQTNLKGISLLPDFPAINSELDKITPYYTHIGGILNSLLNVMGNNNLSESEKTPIIGEFLTQIKSELGRIFNKYESIQKDLKNYFNDDGKMKSLIEAETILINGKVFNSSTKEEIIAALDEIGDLISGDLSAKINGINSNLDSNEIETYINGIIFELERIGVLFDRLLGR